MTDKEIWAIAVAGDGSLDAVLAKEAGMQLEEFQAEKQRRIMQAATAAAQQEDINRRRSTGSVKSADSDNLADPGEDPAKEGLLFLDAIVNSKRNQQALERMEDAFSQNPVPLEGQEILPGFEEPGETDLPLTAENIMGKINQIAFLVDYAKSPEDALIAYNAPAEMLSEYLTLHFSKIVNAAAKATGADPAQIADKEKRTPEQQRLLSEIAASELINRITAFSTSRYMQATTLLIFENLTEKQKELPPILEQIIHQTALYFFAVNEDLKPTEPAALTEEQQLELINLFSTYYSLCRDYEKTSGHPLTDKDLAEVFSYFIDPNPQKTKNKFTQAAESGAIMTIGERLFLPTDPKYQNAFMTSTRAEIGFFRKDPETGARQLAADIEPAFMQALAKSAQVDIYNGNQGDTSVYFPAFARELGLEFNRYATPDAAEPTQDAHELTSRRAEARAAYINKKLTEWDSIWGVLPGSKKEYKLMALHTYNPETEVFTFQSPYLLQLFRELLQKEENALNSGQHYHLWQSELLHASVVNERNPAAVEMACRILQGVQQRGLKPDAKLKQNRGRTFADEKEVTYSITCKTLINDCPQIREKLNSKPNASRRTQELKRTFTAMYKILRTKTDLFSYYKNLTITEVIPTTKTLDAEITISHHGGNPNYKKPFMHLKDLE